MPAAPANGAPALPLHVPGGIADAQSKLGFFSTPDGVEAIDLSTGRQRWRTRQARWPLLARSGWVAALALGATKSAIRVRFLGQADGKPGKDSQPIQLPREAPLGGEAVADESGVSMASATARLTLSASYAPSGRGKDKNARAARLRIDWRLRTFPPATGTDPGGHPEQVVTGVVFIDPATGAVATPEKLPPAADPVLPLPRSFQRERGKRYWSFTDHGAGWSDTPRAFALPDGKLGYFEVDEAARKLRLVRWQSRKQLPPVDLAAGLDFYPALSLDGRYLVLFDTSQKHESRTLFDLGRLPDALATLPPFDKSFQGSLAVLGPLLYYVTEGEGVNGKGATVFPRHLVAVDWATGKRRWSHALVPRRLPHPIP